MSPLVDRKIIEDKGPAASGFRTAMFHDNSSVTCWGASGIQREGTCTQDLFLNFLYSSCNLVAFSSLKHIRHLRQRRWSKMPHIIGEFPAKYISNLIPQRWICPCGLCQLSPTPQESGYKHEDSPKASSLASFLTLNWPSLLVVWVVPDK